MHYIEQPGRDEVERRALRAEADLHMLDTGHFATATHSGEIAHLIDDFMATGPASMARSG